MTTLIVSPHYDDAELAASLCLPGASLLVVCGIDSARREEQERACRATGATLLEPGTFPDGEVDVDQWSVGCIEKAIRIVRPDSVLIPPLLDSHQDHRAVHHASIAAVRRSSLSIVEYETTSALPEWVPNIWEEMSEEEVSAQAHAVSLHASQAHRPYAQPEYLRIRAAYRGQQVARPYAQAYRLVRGVGRLPSGARGKG